MPVQVGDEYSAKEQLKVQDKIKEAVKEIAGNSPTDVAVVNCGNQVWNIYVGLPSQSIVFTNYNPTAHEDRIAERGNGARSGNAPNLVESIGIDDFRHV